MNIPLSRPDITEKEIKEVMAVLRTPYLSLGPKIKEFENKFAKYIEMKYAIAVSNGTAGLHLAIKAMEIKEGDEVITTPFSFIASANCILFERARPVFVDIEPNTLNIDPHKIESKIKNEILRYAQNDKLKIKAILPVHIFGHPCDMDKIIEIAKKYGLKMIEDACESIGSEYNGKKCGTFGDIGVFAFYPNKQMTTGEGGMIVTNDEKIYKICSSLRNQGRNGQGWLSHKILGYNYRLSEMQCALGIAQLSRIDELLKKREKIAQLYNEKLKEIEEIKIPYVAKNVKVSWFVYVIRLNEKFYIDDRDKILIELKKRGIECSNYFPPIHLQPFYKRMFGYKEGDFPITESISKRTIALPFYNNLREEEIDYVVKNLKEIIAKIKKH